MAHKGYTLNYFIDYFQSIPNSQWCRGTNQKEGTEKHCAQGHALRDTRMTYKNTATKKTARLQALNGFLGTSVVAINDNVDKTYSSLGFTERTRVLTALRNRKRYGNIFGKKKSST